MTVRPSLEIDPAAELRDVQLGDKRLNDRARVILTALDRAADQSLPQAMPTEAALEAAYRFFSNERVTFDKLLGPHFAATTERILAAGQVVLVHDTSEFRYEGGKRRAGLGDVTMKGQGFLGHFALAVTGDRQVLGVAGVSILVREPGASKKTRNVDYAKRSTQVRESARWSKLVFATDALVASARPIHAMDCEADDFVLFVAMQEAGCRFVVRMHPARLRKAKRRDGSDDPFMLVGDFVKTLRGRAQREVTLSARAGKRGGRSEAAHPIRDRRLATLEFSAARIELAPPRGLKDQSPLHLNVVHVIEPSPPPGEKPIEWILYSNEPITLASDVLAIVDAYRTRWVIEEFFKALKSGCAIERRQLETKDALLNVLALSIPIAAKMLALRSIVRAKPNAPAVTVLDEIELAALRLIARRPLPERVTAHDAYLAIAGIGGHLPRNGSPGWHVLARGFETLKVATSVLLATRAVAAARRAPTM